MGVKTGLHFLLLLLPGLASCTELEVSPFKLLGSHSHRQGAGWTCWELCAGQPDSLRAAVRTAVSARTLPDPFPDSKDYCCSLSLTCDPRPKDNSSTPCTEHGSNPFFLRIFNGTSPDTPSYTCQLNHVPDGEEDDEGDDEEETWLNCTACEESVFCSRFKTAEVKMKRCFRIEEADEVEPEEDKDINLHGELAFFYIFTAIFFVLITVLCHRLDTVLKSAHAHPS